MIFKTISLIALLMFSSCAPKEEISVFDASMMIRTTEETEAIKNKIAESKDEEKRNKEEIESTLNSLKTN